MTLRQVGFSFVERLPFRTSSRHDESDRRHGTATLFSCVSSIVITPRRGGLVEVSGIVVYEVGRRCALSFALSSSGSRSAD